uniref:Putative ovule protein n=1 Tax=Solanum chacoense TaxID=4108 RepID=A0A0V0HXT7_SOLCH
MFPGLVGDLSSSLVYHFVGYTNTEFSTTMSLPSQSVVSILSSWKVETIQLFVELNHSIHDPFIQVSSKYQFPTLM